MLSIKGIYRNGKIFLLEPLPTNQQESDLIITFLKVSNSSQEIKDEQLEHQESGLDAVQSIQGDEADFKALRKHERHKAHGKIHIADSDSETSYSLYDYSAGGLSFLSDKPFDVNSNITAAVHYTAAGEELTINFEIIVRRVFEFEGKARVGCELKIGCQFTDDMDEELWHTIIG